MTYVKPNYELFNRNNLLNIDLIQYTITAICIDIAFLTEYIRKIALYVIAL